MIYLHSALYPKRCYHGLEKYTHFSKIAKDKEIRAKNKGRSKCKIRLEKINCISGNKTRCTFSIYFT